MKHFISLSNVTAEEFHQLLQNAVLLKQDWRSGGNAPVLREKTLGMVFQKPSLRTRVSFEVAMLQLGGHALYLSPSEIQLGQRESVPDVARVLSGYVDGIMARVFAHDDIVTLAAHAGVPVINGLSDTFHPCQALADMLTLFERWGDEMAGHKIAYVGDGNNVCHSLLLAAALTGMHITVATPEGYEPKQAVVAFAQALRTAGKITILHDPRDAVEKADVIYTDVWTSMGKEEEREQQLRVFPPYQVNRALLAEAAPDVVVLHCLPAHRGEEITDAVMDGPNALVFQQAENRLHAQKALLAALMTQAETKS